MWFSPILTQRSMAIVHAPQCAWVSQLQTISLFSFPRARHKTWLKNACPVVYARATRYTIQKRSFHTLLQPKFIDWAQQKALSKFYLPHPARRTPIRGIKTLANAWSCQACVHFSFLVRCLVQELHRPRGGQFWFFRQSSRSIAVSLLWTSLFIVGCQMWSQLT